MWNLLIILGALAAIGTLVFKFLDEAWFRDPQKASLQKRFEVWWIKVADADSRTLALALAVKLSQILDDYLGIRLFSKRAFSRSFAASTCILVLTLGLIGIHNGRIIGVAPWVAYQNSAAEFEQLLSKEKNHTKDRRRKTTTGVDGGIEEARVTLQFDWLGCNLQCGFSCLPVVSELSPFLFIGNI